MSLNQLTSTVVSALASQNVIASLKSPAERRRLAVVLCAHNIAQSQVTICVSDDPTWTEEVRFAMKESGMPGARQVKRSFIRMSTYEFRHRSRYGLFCWYDKCKLSDVGLILIPDFDLV